MTIKDIARESGYSIGTVSRVLNNAPDVSENARKAVMQIVKKHNFIDDTRIARFCQAQMGRFFIFCSKKAAFACFAQKPHFLCISPII